MANKVNAVDFDDDGYSAFARKAWRLCLWAGLTLTAIATAFLAGYSEIGSRRLALVGTTAPAGEPSQPAASAGRRFDAEVEVRRLSDAVRQLAFDRDRLLGRIGAIEHNLEGTTGSITTTQPSPRAGTAAMPPPMLAPGPSSPPVSTEPSRPPPAVASTPATIPAPPTPIVDLPQITSRPAIAPRASTTSLPVDNGAAASTATRTDFGIDLGGAPTVEGLRALWGSLKGSHEPLLEGLRPVVVVRDGAKPGLIELRLVAGPVANAGIAARLCAVLAATGLTCQPAVFDGQRLALK